MYKHKKIKLLLLFAVILAVTVALAACGGKEGKVSGHVTNGATGEIVPGASLTLTDASGSDTKQGTSDGTGLFELSAKSGTLYTLTASAPGYRTSTVQDISVEAGGIFAASIALDNEDGSVVGKATYSHGAEIPNAMVMIRNAALPEGEDTEYQETLTDEQGNYKFENVRPGSYAVFIAPYMGTPGYETPAFDASGEVTTMDVTLPFDEGGSITGKVINGGAPEGGAFLFFNDASADPNDPDSMRGITTAEDDGTYSLHGLPAGSYKIQVMIGYDVVHTTDVFKIENKQAITQDISFGEKAAAQPAQPTQPTQTGKVAISGKVTNPAGKGVKAMITLSSGGKAVASGYSDPNGSFLFPGHAPGSYQLTASATGYVTIKTNAFEASSGTVKQNLQFTQKATTTGAITGRVTDSANGAGVAGASLKLSTASSDVKTAVTDAKGYYSFADIPAGTYKIEVIANTYAWASVGWFDLTGGTTVSKNAVITKAANAAANGRVLNAAGGAGIPGATLKLINSSNQVVATVNTDSNGAYYFGNIPAATYSIQASAAGYNAATATGIQIQSGKTATKDISLSQQGAVVAGYVMMADGRGIAGATVYLLNASGQSVAAATTNAGGYYTLVGTAGGSYRISVIANGYTANASGNFTLNGTVTQNITLASTAPPVEIGVVSPNPPSVPTDGAGHGPDPGTEGTPQPEAEPASTESTDEGQ